MKGTITRHRLDIPAPDDIWNRFLKRMLDIFQRETQTELSWINHRSMTADVSTTAKFRVLSPIMLLDGGSSGAEVTITLASDMQSPENFHGPLFLKNGNTRDIKIVASNNNNIQMQGNDTEVAMFVKIKGSWNIVNTIS
jgi:hypothetical protein